MFGVLIFWLVSCKGSETTLTPTPSLQVRPKPTESFANLSDAKPVKDPGVYFTPAGAVASIPLADTADRNYEPSLFTTDFNNDGLDDLLITRSLFQTQNTYQIDILLNNSTGNLIHATQDLFPSGAPNLQNLRQVLLEDFNQDGFVDIFVADHGYDVSPHPGYQNTLVLSTVEGKYFDATAKLPQRSDFTHSAAAADVDADGDLDIFIGNIWGQSEIPPDIMLNDGTGVFSTSPHPLPALTQLSENGYTVAAFVDVDNDSDPDLILGDAGDDIANQHSTRTSEILINDGTGIFSHFPNALPPKSFPQDICHAILPFDFNQDNYQDLFMVYEQQPELGSYIQIIINNQDGTFSDQTAVWLQMQEIRVWIPEIWLADINQDGAQDLLARTWDYRNPNPLIFLNDGDNRFNLTKLDFKLPNLYYAFFDLHGDGSNDLIYITVDSEETYHLIRD